MKLQLEFEIGHKASRGTFTPGKGYIYEWELYLRGCHGDLSEVFDNIVFLLPEKEFSEHKRVITEPPFKINGEGENGFHAEIKINYKSQHNPEEAYNYDVTFPKLGPPIIGRRKEKLIFDANAEFAEKLLDGGAYLIDNDDRPVKRVKLKGIEEKEAVQIGKKRKFEQTKEESNSFTGDNNTQENILQRISSIFLKLDEDESKLEEFKNEIIKIVSKYE